MLSWRAVIEQLVTHSRMKTVSANQPITLKRFRAGETVGQIAQGRRLSSGTIYGHLTSALEAGERVDLSQLLNAEEQKQIAAAFRSAFPDLTWDVELLVADGDYVVGRWTASGTHRGPWGGVAPTGRGATFSGVNIFRLDGGKVVEIWNHRDDLGLREQLDAAVYADAPSQKDS